MKFQTRGAFPVLLALLVFSAVLPIHAQRAIPTVPHYTPPPAPRTVPRSTPVQSRPVTQHQTNSVPQHQTNTAPQHQTPVTPQHPAPERTTPPTPTRSQVPPSSVNQSRASRPQPAPARQDRTQQQSQQKENARQQKERAKQEQKAQKEQARRHKEEAKQQEKQKKEQARQEKQRKKEEHKGQKERARQNQGTKSPNEVVAKPAESPRALQSHSASASAYRIPEASAISGKAASGSTTLTRSGSESVIHQINSARANMTGTNRKPLPSGDVTVRPNGRLTVNAAGGRQYGVRSDGTVASYRDSTKSVSLDHSGEVSSLHSANLEVRRGSHGERSVISRGANNATLVSTGRHSGYMEHNVAVGSRTYLQRTTVINQRIVTRNYVAFTYGGVGMARFVTPVFFAPAFYGWAFYPWGVPIHFTFGWAAAPWYVGPHPFAAYPEYPGAAYWLTDYAIGETLSDAYQLDADLEIGDNADFSADAVSADADETDQTDRLNAEATTPISAEIKDSIVEQVKQELSYDSAASNAHVEETGYDEVSSVLSRPNQVFVVSSSLDVSTVDEQVCGLQPGDILKLTSASVGNSELVQLRVASSKRRDCPVGVVVTVSMSDLQDMHNNFRAHVEAGLGELLEGQGRNGIPVAPASVAAPARPNIADESAISASEMNSALEAQRQQADIVEAQIVKEAFSQGQ
jgi:hypothetical protein